MKTLFIAAGPYHWGSSRMRCWWVTPEMKADCVEWDQFKYTWLTTDHYNTLIFQKNIQVEMIRSAKGAGKQVFWDVCDPSWWWEPKHARECADLVDGIVASSEALAEDFIRWYGNGDKVHTIPDRLDLSKFPHQREHQHADPVRFIWYGVAVNRLAIFAALANLERLVANGHRIELTIFDNGPHQPFKITDAFPIYHTEWKLERENEILTAHDIALLPPYPGPWGRVKSNNKKLTAWANGLAVTEAQDYERLEAMTISTQRRREDAKTGLDLIKLNYQVALSARQWERIVTL